MILISHRGNLEGKKKDLENSPEYIQAALEAGFEVEIDVWYVDKKWYLGHDEPNYEIDITFLMNDKLWCHAKNIESLYELFLYDKNIHYFWHQDDDFTLTSKGYIWTYPGKKLTDMSICVLPERFDYDIINAYGICSDYISTFKN